MNQGPNRSKEEARKILEELKKLTRNVLQVLAQMYDVRATMSENQLQAELCWVVTSDDIEKANKHVAAKSRVDDGEKTGAGVLGEVEQGRDMIVVIEGEDEADSGFNTVERTTDANRDYDSDDSNDSDDNNYDEDDEEDEEDEEGEEEGGE